MNTLDTMSRTIGSIEADLRSMKETQVRQGTHTEQIFEMLRRIEARMASHDDHREQMKKTAEKVERHDDLIMKGAGVVVTLTILAGAVGTFIAAGLKAALKWLANAT